MPTVDVATIGKVASGLVLLVCVASLLIGWLTGFHAIFPPIGLLIAAIAVLLGALSVALAKQWKK